MISGYCARLLHSIITVVNHLRAVCVYSVCMGMYKPHGYS